GHRALLLTVGSTTIPRSTNRARHLPGSGDDAGMTTSTDPRYWRSAAEDAAMQDEHGFIWLAMLDTIDVDLAGTRVLDAGCNRGGVLRLLADTRGIAEGLGYDPAAGAIDDARRLAGDRPL